MLYTLAGDPSEYPPGMSGPSNVWLAFSPNNEVGGFQMGIAACHSSGPNRNMPIVFIKGPPGSVWCDQIATGFQRGLDTCPTHYNFLKATVNADGWTEKHGKRILESTMLQYPEILGAATCADALAAGAGKFWTSFNNGLFAAGFFIASFGADPAFKSLVDTRQIQITIDPMIDTEGAGVVRAVKFASIAFVNNEVKASQDLVVSPVEPRGKYLKSALKKTALGMYDKLLRPKDGGTPDAFDIKVQFTSISNVKFADQTFEASGWLTMNWADERAVWNAAIYSLFTGKMNWDIDAIYRPELIWPNRIEDKIRNPQQVLQSDGSGNFEYLTEFRGIYSCEMDIASFPKDVQECKVSITTREPAHFIQLKARDVMCGPRSTGDYYLRYRNFSAVEAFQKKPEDPDTETMAYTQANFDVIFQRDAAVFSNTVIIPCIMLFLVGYSSLFLTAQPARAAFCIISLLNVVGVLKTGREMTPVHVGNVWVDDFLITHLVFAFIILVVNVAAFHPKLQVPKVAEKPAVPDKTAEKVERNPLMESTDLLNAEEGACKDRGRSIEMQEHHSNSVSYAAPHIGVQPGNAVFSTSPVGVAPARDIAIRHANEGSFADDTAEKPVKEDRDCNTWWIDTMRWFGQGPVLIGGNYLDIIMQRAIPILYGIIIIVLFAVLAGNAQEYPEYAKSVPSHCAEEKSLDEWMLNS